MQQVTIQDARNDLANLVAQTAIAGRQFVITKFGKPSAMLVPVKKKPNKKLAALDAAFGIWKDRKDIKDTAQWVADLRTKMSLRIRE